MNKAEVSFNGKSIVDLSLAELYDFQSETIESCIIHNDKLNVCICSDKQNCVCCCNDCANAVLMSYNTLQKDENKLALIAKEIDKRYSTVMV